MEHKPAAHPPHTPATDAAAAWPDTLPTSLDAQRDKLRFCTGECQAERPVAGGVETSPGRFRCAHCWAAFQARMKFR